MPRRAPHPRITAHATTTHARATNWAHRLEGGDANVNGVTIGSPFRLLLLKSVLSGPTLVRHDPAGLVDIGPLGTLPARC